jgi:hypothetical protein
VRFPVRAVAAATTPPVCRIETSLPSLVYTVGTLLNLFMFDCEYRYSVPTIA